MAPKKGVTKAQLKEQQEARQGRLRSLASIGGCSKRTIAKQLKFIRDNPEARLAFHARSHAQCVRKGRLQPPLCIYLITFASWFDCAPQVLAASNVSRESDVLKGLSDDREPGVDWASIPLQKALPYLCTHSPNFRDALAEIARFAGRHKACMHPFWHKAKDAVTTASTLACTVSACPHHAVSRWPCMQVYCGMSFCMRMA